MNKHSNHVVWSGTILPHIHRWTSPSTLYWRKLSHLLHTQVYGLWDCWCSHNRLSSICAHEQCSGKTLWRRARTPRVFSVNMHSFPEPGKWYLHSDMSLLSGQISVNVTLVYVWIRPPPSRLMNAEAYLKAVKCLETKLYKMCTFTKRNGFAFWIVFVLILKGRFKVTLKHQKDGSVKTSGYKSLKFWTFFPERLPTRPCFQKGGSGETWHGI